MALVIRPGSLFPSQEAGALLSSAVSIITELPSRGCFIEENLCEYNEMVCEIVFYCINLCLVAVIWVVSIELVLCHKTAYKL